MVSEASKTNLIRKNSFYDEYMRGKVIDIGSGGDLVVPHAEPFDTQHGNAQAILNYKKKGEYDCVHSSHCLEHMEDVELAIKDWWALVKSRGHMIIVVPEENLYEQEVWPSIFNLDHKATFRIKGEKSWSPVSYDIVALASTLPDSQILDVSIQDMNYDYDLMGVKFGSYARKLFLWNLVRKSGLKHTIGMAITSRYKHLLIKYGQSSSGLPVDQTLGSALAQIQIILKRNN